MLRQCHVTTILPVVNVDRARRFYEEKLGLERGEKTAEGGLHYRTGGGGEFELSPRKEPTKNPYTAMSFEVSNLENEVKDLESRGVAFEDYNLPDLKTVSHIFTMADEKCAWFKDPEGNILCVHEGTKGRH
jgi:catechol 2,3-dioxygenase-like lactoylglutathione lyase family enzyme